MASAATRTIALPWRTTPARESYAITDSASVLTRVTSAVWRAAPTAGKTVPKRITNAEPWNDVKNCSSPRSGAPLRLPRAPPTRSVPDRPIAAAVPACAQTAAARLMFARVSRLEISIPATARPRFARPLARSWSGAIRAIFRMMAIRAPMTSAKRASHRTRQCPRSTLAQGSRSGSASLVNAKIAQNRLMSRVSQALCAIWPNVSQ